MQVEEVGPRDKRKIALVVILVLLAVFMLTRGAYSVWLAYSDPPMPQSLEDIEDLLADERYQGMSRAEREAYQSQIRDVIESLEGDERDRFRDYLLNDDAAMSEAIDMGLQQVRGIHGPLANAPDERTRDQVLDGMIVMQQVQEARSGRGNRNPEDMTEEQREQMDRMVRNMLDSGDPQPIGYISEIFRLVEERREERGLPPSSFGR